MANCREAASRLAEDSVIASTTPESPFSRLIRIANSLRVTVLFPTHITPNVTRLTWTGLRLTLVECVEGNLGSDREQCERVLAGWVQSAERLSAAGFEFPDYLPRERGMFGWCWKVPEVLRERGLDREFNEFVEGVDLDRMYEIDSEIEVRAEYAFSHALASLGHAGRANFRFEGNAEVARGVVQIDPPFLTLHADRHEWEMIRRGQPLLTDATQLSATLTDCLMRDALLYVRGLLRIRQGQTSFPELRDITHPILHWVKDRLRRKPLPLVTEQAKRVTLFDTLAQPPPYSTERPLARDRVDIILNDVTVGRRSQGGRGSVNQLEHPLGKQQAEAGGRRRGHGGGGSGGSNHSERVG